MILTDKEIFCEQIRLCEDAMYALAISIVKNDSDATEILSESVFKGYKNLGSLKNINSFKPWIMRIVHNTAVEYIRKNSKIISLEQVEITADRNENKIINSISLKTAVQNLKPQYQTVIILYYYEDFSISQISKITGVSTVTVKQRLSRARKMLREFLKEDFGNE